MFTHRFFKQLIRVGNLTVADHSGVARAYGDGSGPQIRIALNSRKAQWRALLNPTLAAGELYMEGELTIEQGGLHEFLSLAAANADNLKRIPAFRLAEWIAAALRRLHGFNPAARARKNAAHHYDLSGELYDLFLDEDRQYSCAYFRRDDDSLAQAQLNKKRHIAAKLLLDRPGLKILDIGCGWGGMGLYLAGQNGAIVDGITLSQEQHKIANQRARQAGLADRARFHLRDYRRQQGRYDRIVSVGMFEHVGRAHYRAFFRKARESLADDGVMLLHSIGTMGPPEATNAWIRKYIFPGGYNPSLSEVLQAVEREGLYVTDIEIWRLHYAKTLRAWGRRFAARRDRVKAIYDERFCRMWEFYLTASRVAFEKGRLMVFQMQLAKRQQAAPLTRDYMARAWEATDAGESPK